MIDELNQSVTMPQFALASLVGLLLLLGVLVAYLTTKAERFFEQHPYKAKNGESAWALVYLLLFVMLAIGGSLLLMGVGVGFYIGATS